MKHFIRAKFMLPLSAELGRDSRIEDGYVLYEEGKIVEVGPFTPQIGQALLQNYPGHIHVVASDQIASSLDHLIRLEGVLLPGFIKSHGHDHEAPIIGIVKDVPLTQWLDGAVNVFGKFIQEQHDALRDRLGCSPHLITYLKARVDDIYYGITASMAHHCSYYKNYVAELVEANERAGTSMIVAVGSQDRNYFSEVLDTPDLAMRRLEDNFARFGSLAHTRIIPGPDQFFSNSPQLLKRIKEWAERQGSLLHIHSSEEYNTTEWFKKEYGMTPVEYGHSVGFLGENTILAHQVQCTERDLELLCESGTKVVHNPLANTILGSGMPPIIEMMEKGIDVVISTDGSGSADNQNILAAARLASQYQKAFHRDATLLPAQKVLEMITVEPARMFGLNKGSLAPGKDADIIVVDVRRPNMVPAKRSNILENLIWASDGSEVQYVVAAGKLLKDNYRLTTLDEADIRDKIQTLSEQLDDYRARCGKLQGTGVNRN